MSTTTTVRTAVVKGNGATAERVAAYLPSNYEVVGGNDEGVIISGHDNAGWTLDDYVLPRLASGCLFGTEVNPTVRRKVSRTTTVTVVETFEVDLPVDHAEYDRADLDDLITDKSITANVDRLTVDVIDTSAWEVQS